MREKVANLMEMTQRSEEEVCCALNECDNDMDKAVLFLLETLPVGAFETSSKKKKNRLTSVSNDATGGGADGDWNDNSNTNSGSNQNHNNGDPRERSRSRGGMRGGRGGSDSRGCKYNQLFIKFTHKQKKSIYSESNQSNFVVCVLFIGRGRENRENDRNATTGGESKETWRGGRGGGRGGRGGYVSTRGGRGGRMGPRTVGGPREYPPRTGGSGGGGDRGGGVGVNNIAKPQENHQEVDSWDSNQVTTEISKKTPLIIRMFVLIGCFLI